MREAWPSPMSVPEFKTDVVRVPRYVAKGPFASIAVPQHWSGLLDSCRVGVPREPARWVEGGLLSRRVEVRGAPIPDLPALTRIGEVRPKAVVRFARDNVRSSRKPTSAEQQYSRST